MSSKPTDTTDCGYQIKRKSRRASKPFKNSSTPFKTGNLGSKDRSRRRPAPRLQRSALPSRPPRSHQRRRPRPSQTRDQNSHVILSLSQSRLRWQRIRPHRPRRHFHLCRRISPPYLRRLRSPLLHLHCPRHPNRHLRSHYQTHHLPRRRHSPYPQHRAHFHPPHPLSTTLPPARAPNPFVRSPRRLSPISIWNHSGSSAKSACGSTPSLANSASAKTLVPLSRSWMTMTYWTCCALF